MDFGRCKGRKIEVDFIGGDITSDAGVLLLKNVDQKINLTPRGAKILNDPRVKKYCKHSVLSMLRQLIYGIALGYEDFNGHDQLRNYKLIQTVVGSDKQLASSPTLCRFKNWIDRKALVDMTKVLIKTFVESHTCPPKELILDFDGTDNKIHGNQVGGLYHGYCRHKCFLPSEVKELFNETNEKQRLFGEFGYAAKTWKKDRRVIVKAECNKHGLNTRYIITNLNGEPKLLYDNIYCARGEMENRIKEQQLCLFTDRTSSKKWLTNQFRLLLSAMVYTLLEGMRRIAFKKTELARFNMFYYSVKTI